MSRRLLLLRHGRTAWNEEGRAQGHADVPLDGTGHAQARDVAGHLAALELHALWSSDLARARQTAECVRVRSGVPVTQDARLREFDVGLRQGLTLAEFAAQFPEEYATWVAGRELVPTKGGEGALEVEVRMLAALRECLAGLPPRASALVVTHGAAIKVAVAGLLGWPQELALTLKGVDNCAWVTLEEVEHGGRLRLAGYNQKPHPA